ncbi:hypothetical protein ANCDUO_07713 [Ancylostoma duodenale]|uniref:Reverse transcriptase domain-containing protein n=1 Tax=Ancylostoma duodenale TaxID=51022 RepID=A0A0C2DHR1_9BILA|nr:hypothetical protein ANCDUO_07713 [Ancylostoma duodenale]
MERRISVMEMRMLRWMGGITQLDRMCNQNVRQRFGVVAIADKLHEARLRWFGHVLRASGDKVCRIGFDVDMPEKRPKGRPKQRWLTFCTPISSWLECIPTRRATEQKLKLKDQQSGPRYETGQTL